MSKPPEAAPAILGGAARQAEACFLATGQRLERAVALLDRLATRFGAYLSQIDNQTISETRGNLAIASQQIREVADVRRSDHQSLADMQRIVTAIGHRLATLQPIVREVDVLALNARVMAGGMGEAGVEFGIFAGHIRTAARHAHTCMAVAQDVRASAAQHLVDACAEAGRFVQRYDPVLRAIPQRLAENLASLTEQRQRSNDAAAEAHRQSIAVGQQVAEHILALQLGDIIRQRIEHVQTAVLLAAGPCRQANLLLAAHLHDIVDELQHGGEQIEQGLYRLAEAAQAIGRLGHRLHDGTDGRHEGFVTLLETDIRESAELAAELDAADAATDQRMVAVLDAANVLTSRLAALQSVQEDIRIMGLNATLRCNRMGTVGRPLAAVAQELRQCSGRFAASAAGILDDLQRLQPIAVMLCDPARRTRHAALAQATSTLLSPLQALADLEQDLTTALTQLEADATEVGRLVEDAVSRLEQRRELIGALRQLAEAFEEGSCDGGEGAMIDAQQLLDHVAAGYTMERERSIHRRFAALPEAETQDDLADILF